jgi:pantetheine-phosphate adenylyltransferase
VDVADDVRPSVSASQPAFRGQPSSGATLARVAVALYAGSFDPIHLGHLGVIEHAARAYERVVVAVVANPEKSAGMFRAEERLRLLTGATAHLPTVRSVQFYGLTVALARTEGATVLVRTGHKERGNEFSMAAMNRVLAEIPTVFVPADARTRTISSSLIRQLVGAGEVRAAQQLVPACVRQALADVTTIV